MRSHVVIAVNVCAHQATAQIIHHPRTPLFMSIHIQIIKFRLVIEIWLHNERRSADISKTLDHRRWLIEIKVTAVEGLHFRQTRL